MPIPKGKLVGDEPCPWCDGTLYYHETKTANLIWGSCYGGPLEDQPHCGSRSYLGRVPSHERLKARAEAERAPTPPTIDQEAPTDGIQTSNRKSPDATNEPAAKSAADRSGIGMF